MRRYLGLPAIKHFSCVFCISRHWGQSYLIGADVLSYLTLQFAKIVQYVIWLLPNNSGLQCETPNSSFVEAAGSLSWTTLAEITRRGCRGWDHLPEITWLRLTGYVCVMSLDFENVGVGQMPTHRPPVPYTVPQILPRAEILRIPETQIYVSSEMLRRKTAWYSSGWGQQPNRKV